MRGAKSALATLGGNGCTTAWAWQVATLFTLRVFRMRDRGWIIFGPVYLLLRRCVLSAVDETLFVEKRGVLQRVVQSYR